MGRIRLISNMTQMDAKDLFNDNKSKTQLLFTAINRKLEAQIPSGKEGKSSGKGHVTWGDSDDYPTYLYDKYLNCTILSTIVNGTTDFVSGNGVKSNTGMAKPNPTQTWDEIIQLLASDYLIFGCAYIQVIRSKGGQVKEFYHLDARYMRTDENCQTFYFNKQYGERYARSNKTVIYPAFNPEAVGEPASVIMVKTPQSRGVYGTTIWGSSMRSVLTAIEIEKFHYSEIKNGFSASAIINLNNGQPTPEEAEQIEDDIYEKLAGSENAGAFILSFNNGKDNATTVERLSTDDFDKRYDALATRTDNMIYQAFGANKNLFGGFNEGSSFSTENYTECFTLYNRTRVRPIQMRLIDAFDRALGTTGSLTIDPYSLTENTNNETNVN